ncbi:ABC transporter permease [Desulfotignum phosphitoxidans]|uniref:Sulfonate permease n=2 Tax=Desulfotignum phosphitoxidans TaxID=190898 RepID=S0FXS2_9BACT|nr:ABC transporter permease [Desulfotignum phosphitoxidans]EMS77969.1 sulfonate permease [Desulfotignum phosphitoxidans DSM 13687]
MRDDFQFGKKAGRLLIKIILPAMIIAGWQILVIYGDLPPILLPKLEKVGADFITYLMNGELLHHVLISLRRCAIGFFAGSATGIAMGILLGWFRRLEDFFDVTLNFSRSIPKTALAPLLIVWFGFGDFPKVLLIGLGAFFYTVIPTLEGVRNVDNLLVKSARSMGANDRQIVLSVILPASMPSIYAGIRIAAASSFVILLFVEIISGNSGLGFLLENSRESLNTSTMFMTLIVVGILGFSLDWLVRFTEKKVMPWQRGRTLSR